MNLVRTSYASSQILIVNPWIVHMKSMDICQRHSKIACNFCAVAMEPWSLSSYLVTCVHWVIVPQHALSSCLGRGYSSRVRSERINIVILINEAKRKVTAIPYLSE